MNSLIPFARFLGIVLMLIGGGGIVVSTFLLLLDAKTLPGMGSRVAFYIVAGYVGSMLWSWDPREKK